MGITDINSSEDESYNNNMLISKSNRNKTPSGRNSPSGNSLGSISDSATPTTAPSTDPSNNNSSSHNQQQHIFIGGDLDSLKREKNELHALLRNFERQFYDQHRRQVESFADIRPVANQYRRYKEIKRQIATLTSSPSSSSN